MSIKHLLLITGTSIVLSSCSPQSWQSVLADPTTQTAVSSVLESVLGGATAAQGNGSALSTSDVISGLKEALNTGVGKGTNRLSAVDGFFKDAALKILLPQEAQKVENTLRSIGLGKQVDNAILSMNRAAEDAVKTASPIFLNAIKQMTIQDAWGILRGNETAATSYLQSKTTSTLTEAFRPTIESSLQKVNATKYWNTAITSYNAISNQKINPDLAAYVTEKAMSGIFLQIAKEEQAIRKDPVARTTEILKKVFGG